MPLDPQIQAMLDERAPHGPLIVPSMSADEARAALIAAFAGVPKGPALSSVVDRLIPGPLGDIPVRIYHPGGSRPLPIVIFYHGGGFVVGDLETHDAVSRHVAKRAHCLVVSVDYRLAPENRFPAAAEDSYAALEWVAAHAAEIGGDATRIVVGGESAGGNLAAVVALMARDRRGPALAGQWLIYPVTDHYAAGNPSYELFAAGYGLSRDEMLWFWDHYLGHKGPASDPYAAPMAAKDLSGLAPAFVLTAEYDTLRDEGEAYGARLVEAGVPTLLTRYDGLNHGFFMVIGVIDAAERPLADSIAWLGRMFAAKPERASASA